MKSKLLFQTILFLVLGNIMVSVSQSSDIPEPIPLNIELINSPNTRDGYCDSCSATYDLEGMGAECCDDAYQLYSGLTCEVLETQYYWNCSGCECPGDEEEFESSWGCTDDTACNYSATATADNESCEYAQENFDCDGDCTADIDCDGECGGSAVIEVDALGGCGGGVVALIATGTLQD